MEVHEPSSSEQPRPPPADPPDGGYGWVCVVAVFFVNGFTWGIVTTFGIFLAYYLEHNLFPGGTSVDYAFIGSLNFTCAMLMAPIATRTCAYCNFKFTLVAGVFLLSGGFIAASFANSIWQLFLSQGACVGIGIGLIYVPMLPIVSQWFSKRRGLANGITSSGAGIGGMAMSFATQALIQKLGVHWALRVTGLIALVVNLPATLVLRNRDDTILPNRKAFDLSLLRRYEVLLMLLWAFVMMFGYLTLTYSLSDYGKAIGLSNSQAFYQTAFMNLGIGVGRPLIGFLSDRFGRTEIAGLLTFTTGIICFAIWIPATSFGLLTFFSILGGSMLGILWPSLGPVATDVVGLKDLYSALSLAWMTVALPLTFSEVIALKLRRPDASRPYLYPQIFAGLSYLVASLFTLELCRVLRKRKRDKIAALDNSASGLTVSQVPRVELVKSS